MTTLDCLPALPTTIITASAGSSWSGLTYGSGSETVRDAVRLTAAISGDLSGSVDAGTIYRLQVGGDIRGPVTATAAAGDGVGAIGFIVAANILNGTQPDTTTPTGSITATLGDIDVVLIGTTAVPGKVQGALRTPLARLGRIEVVGPIAIASPGLIEAGTGIDAILARSSTGTRYAITSDITTNSNDELGDAALGALYCGTFTGDIVTTVLGGGSEARAVDIQGDLVGSITTTGDSVQEVFVRDDVTGTGGIDIGGDLVAPLAVGTATAVHVAGDVKNPLGSLGGTRLSADSIGTLTIGGNCLGLVHLGAFHQIDIFGSIIEGPLQVDAFGADDAIRVGASIKNGPLAGTDSTPIQTTGCQSGLIVLNALADSGTWEQGVSYECTDGLVTIRPGNNAPDDPPSYHRVNPAGGSTSLTPTHLHAQACSPSLDLPIYDSSHPADDRTFANSDFCGIAWNSHLCAGSPAGTDYGSGTAIELTFFGSIMAERTTGYDARPYVIHIRAPNGSEDTTTDYGVWTRYEILPDSGGTHMRRLRIWGGEQTQLPTGHYYIRPKLTGTARLLCAELLPGADPTPVANFLYQFELFKDCNTNGIEDGTGSDTSLCCDTPPCNPDYTMDGNADSDDIAYLIDIVGGGYNWAARDPDFNQDGNVDQSDVDALVNTIGGGGCP